MLKKNILLICLLVFSFALRFWQLDTNPAGLFCDEASVGYDALRIIKTGKDRHGDFLPLFFKGFNYDNVSPYQVYLTVPFVALFGLNEKAVRLTPVFWSIIELLIFYLLLVQFIPKSFALLGTLILSLSPWHFHISRINMGDYYSWTLLTLTAYLFLVIALAKKKRKYFIASAIFFGLATYSYTPARLTTPMIFGLTLLHILPKKYFKIVFLMAFVYMITLIPFIHFHLTNPHSFQRIKDTMGIDIRNQRPANQPQTNRLGQFANKYFLHYSDAFLFQKGDADFPGQFIRRHSIAGLGLLYPYQKWLIAAGIIWIAVEVYKKRRFELLFVFILLLVFPVADSLTNDSTPFATRSYLGVLPFHLLVAFGIWGIFEILSKLRPPNKQVGKASFALILTILIILSSQKLFQRFNENPLTTSDFWGWQYGPREIMKYFLAVSDSYDDLYMSGEFNGASIFPKFYDPENDCQNKCRIGDFWRVPAIYNPQKHQLFSLSPAYLKNSKLQDKFITKKTIYYPDGKTAFLIGEVKK